MFTIDDLWKIMLYLKDGTISPGLDGLTSSLATSEREISKAFFEQILDQNTFVSNDYRRLRTMLIDWYSSHKTIATTQKYASDVHRLPNKHLSELFRSFGFPLGLDIVPLSSKANFFLDLVNFYKKKGTPETIVDVLDYYGFSDADLVEYWLQKDMYGNLVFRGESVRVAATGSTVLIDSDVSFNKMTKFDPHWIQTKEEILALHLTNKINLPSKSPYYSLSSIFSLFTINISLSILFRIIQDQYNRVVLDLPLPYNVPVKNLGLVVPLLHVYVGTIYAFERMFGNSSNTDYTRYGCYNGNITYIGDPPIPTDLFHLIKEYESLIVRPTSVLERDSRLIDIESKWSSPLTQNFLNSIKAATPLLESLNPTFKAVIDSWFDLGDQNYLITYLIGTLDNWIRLHINTKSPSLAITMLGLGFRDEILAIINFFKPYRARLAFMDTAFSIKNPLTESILTDEKIITEIDSYYRNPIRPITNPKHDPCCKAYLSTLCGNKLKDSWLYDEKGDLIFRYDIGGVYDIDPAIQMDLNYITNSSNLNPNPIPYEDNTPEICGTKLPREPIFRYDMGGFHDMDPVMQMDQAYIDRENLIFPMPPGYGGNCAEFRYDIGAYHDIPPMEQMDEEYLKRLNEFYESLHLGSICDGFNISIETFIHERLGESFVYGNYDTGEFHDDYGRITRRWHDELNSSIIQQPSSLGEIIPVIDGPLFTIESKIVDNFGTEPPNQYDVGQYFDSVQTKSIVRDSFHIDISSVGLVECFSNSSANLSTGNIELMQGTSTITSNVFNTNLTIGKIESLSATKNIISLVITTRMYYYNNYYDTGSFYDSGPLNAPVMPPSFTDTANTLWKDLPTNIFK